MTTTQDLPELVGTEVHRQVREPTIIRSDTYPANVDFSWATHNYPRLRAIVTLRKVLVLCEGATTVNTLYEAPMLDAQGDGRKITITTEDGTLTISKASGCGCGSSLKSYRAFPDSQRMARP